MSEQLRAYNDLNEDLGLLERSLIHKEGYWHKVIHTFVLHPQGLIFSQRSDSKKFQQNLLSTSSSGHYQENTPVFQELEEELGIIPEKSQFLGRKLFFHEQRNSIQDKEYQDLYVVTYSQLDFKIDPLEIKAIFFFPLEKGIPFFSQRGVNLELKGLSSSYHSLEKSFTYEDFLPLGRSFYLTSFYQILAWKKSNFAPLDLF